MLIPLSIIIIDSIAEVSRADWSVSYDLGEGWKQARRIKKQNSSLFKVDIVVYPELLFRNYILSKVYEIVVNVSPPQRNLLKKPTEAVRNVRCGKRTVCDKVTKPGRICLYLCP